ncbi:MAG: nitroreductase family protein [Victivallales bacterium]|nr:nitroreductase family protein [Victivallales bacterium]
MKEIKYWLATRRVFKPYFRYVLKQLGSHHRNSSRQKYSASIIMQSHVIEKGLSLKEIRPGYGVPKILKLLDDLSTYYKIYQDAEVLYFSLSIIQAYLDYNRGIGVENEEIQAKFQRMWDLLGKEDLPAELRGGGVHLRREDIWKDSRIDYQRFVMARHSIRNFTGERVDKALLDKAFEMAEYTPSACNRQPWHNFVFTKKENIIKVLDLQTGARQFKEDVGALILVTSSANCFFGHEFNQSYLNGGMYAMNLMLALHSLGLGAVPLNMGIAEERLKQIREFCKIPDAELPILLIAVGVISEELTVAASRRFDFRRYTTFD